MRGWTGKWKGPEKGGANIKNFQCRRAKAILCKPEPGILSAPREQIMGERGANPRRDAGLESPSGPRPLGY